MVFTRYYNPVNPGVEVYYIDDFGAGFIFY